MNSSGRVEWDIAFYTQSGLISFSQHTANFFTIGAMEVGSQPRTFEGQNQALSSHIQTPRKQFGLCHKHIKVSPGEIKSSCDDIDNIDTILLSFNPLTYLTNIKTFNSTISVHIYRSIFIMWFICGWMAYNSSFSSCHFSHITWSTKLINYFIQWTENQTQYYNP